MEKIEIKLQKNNRYRKVWDLGITGLGITERWITSKLDYFPEEENVRKVILIPYGCYKCGFKESYRE